MVILRSATVRLKRVGRRLGVLPYRSERWTTAQWDEAYRAGTLDHFGSLPELARYSMIVGYVGWWGSNNGRVPSVLDIGCGPGLLRERLTVPFQEYVGVDLSAAAVAEADARGFERSRFVTGDVAALDLGRFDVVVLNEVLYYAPDPAALLRAVAGLVDPGGVIVVSMWRHDGDRTLWRTVEGVLPLVDAVEVRNRGNGINRRGWRIAVCRAS